jgi:hypothetical protein
MSAIIAAVEGPGWQTKDDRKAVAAELRDDLDAVIATLLWPGNDSCATLAMCEGSARMIDIADDARVVAYFTDRHAHVAEMRTALPAALARQGVSMMPANLP